MKASSSGRFGRVFAGLWGYFFVVGVLFALFASPALALSIVEENALPGNPKSEWDISGAGSTNILGFATDISVNRGQTINFKIKTNSKNYRIDIYRLGYYGGAGARKVATIQKLLTTAQSQPSPKKNAASGLVDAGNWGVSASWTAKYVDPNTSQLVDATSGVYIAKLVRQDGTAGSNHIPFIVRDDTGSSELLMQTSDTTWQAYNAWGGNSLYVGSPAGRAYKVSYNRPITNRGGGNGTGPRDYLFDSDYPLLRWLEANGYDVSYMAGVDTDRRGGNIRNHDVFIAVGHDEYWSGGQRANVEAARDAGVNLAFFNGNEVFWKTRWENSIAGPVTAYRTLVCYKETHANDRIDPKDASPTWTWTGTWRDPRFSLIPTDDGLPPADGGRPENALTGTIFTVNDGSVDRIAVPAEYRALRFWRNTTNWPSDGKLTANALTYEWDEDLDNGARPAGLIRLSSTLDPDTQYLQDYGSSYASAPATHHLTLYRAASGALVFAAGTTRWAWGLDATHDNDSGGSGATATDIRIQQATVNLFADMDVFPATLQSGFTPAAKSTDFAAPASSVTPPTGGPFGQGQSIQIAGTASDAGGGTVGGVEASIDLAGTTPDKLRWHPTTVHPATGQIPWSYAWVAPAPGTYTIKSRAVDDSGNLENPGTGVTITVTGSPPPPPPPPGAQTIWSSSTTPAVITDSDTGAVELGVKFQATSTGYITGLRFYKGPSNTGTHVGHLWAANGQLLATVTFGNETASGWQQVNLAAPVQISANTTYVASYHTNVGHYSANVNYFGTGVVNGNLQALADSVANGNGVYAYGPSGNFPADTWNKSNYWVDVVFNTQLQ